MACHTLSRFMLPVVASTGEVEGELVQPKGGQAASTPGGGPSYALVMWLGVLLSTPCGEAMALSTHPRCVQLVTVATWAPIDRQDTHRQLACGPLSARYTLCGGPLAGIFRRPSRHVAM